MEDIEEDDDYQVDDYQNNYTQSSVPEKYVAALQFQKIYGNIDNWDDIIEDIYYIFDFSLYFLSPSADISFVYFFIKFLNRTLFSKTKHNLNLSIFIKVD